jgi:hypothetical protein
LHILIVIHFINWPCDYLNIAKIYIFFYSIHNCFIIQILYIVNDKVYLLCSYNLIYLITILSLNSILNYLSYKIFSQNILSIYSLYLYHYYSIPYLYMILYPSNYYLIISIIYMNVFYYVYYIQKVMMVYFSNL